MLKRHVRISVSREEYEYEEIELPRELWNRIYESVLLLRWIDIGN